MSSTPTPYAKLIKLPIGDITPIMHTGSIQLSKDLVLHDVLYDRDFHFNLSPSNKLKQSLNCAVIFFQHFVFFRTCHGGS